MDVQAKLTEIREAVATARAMPMSASCVVNRAELLSSLDELAQMLPQAFSESDRVLATRDDLMDKARERPGRSSPTPSGAARSWCRTAACTSSPAPRPTGC